VEAERRELLSSEGKAVLSRHQLLPAALDLVVFMAIWIGLSGRHSGQVRMPVQSNVVRPESAIQSEQTPRREPKTLFQRRANDYTNVVPFHAA